MKMLLGDLQYHEVMIDGITKELAERILSNPSEMFGSDYIKAFDIECTVEDLIADNTHTIVVDGELAGFIALENVSDDGEGTTYDVSLYGAIVPKFRGLGVMGKAINLVCMCEDVDTAYWVVKHDNLKSMKACKGFQVCSNQNLHFSDLDSSEYIKFVKYFHTY